MILIAHLLKYMLPLHTDVSFLTRQDWMEYVLYRVDGRIIQGAPFIFILPYLRLLASTQLLWALINTG